MNLLHLQVRIEIGKLLHFLRHQGISGMIGLLPVFKHPKKCEVRLRQRLVAVFFHDPPDVLLEAVGSEHL